MQGTVGEIRIFAGSTIPTGWLLCNGASLAIASYPNLHGAIGTSFGGSGANFNLPNLDGRTVLGVGTSTSLGQIGGGSATLIVNNLPAHNHTITGQVTPQAASDGALSSDPTGRYTGPGSFYSGPYDLVVMAPISATGLTVSNTGSGTAFDVIPPYVGVNYIIYSV